MKRYLILIMAILLLVAPLAGCTTTIPESDTEPAQPDAKLIEFQQIKMMELSQLNTALADLQAKIREKDLEYKHLEKLLDVANERISKLVGYPVNPTWGEWYAYCTSEESYLYNNKICPLSRELSELRLQESRLLAKKQYLEQVIEEVKQYKRLADYHEFKLSQLEKLEAKLVKMQLDWEQELIIGGYSLEHSSKHPAGYEMGLLERQLLQQDIKQLEQLSGNN